MRAHKRGCPMARLEKSIIIHAPWEKVDAIANDGRRTPEWYEGVESTTVDGTYPQVGGVSEQVYKASGMTFNIKMTVEAYEKGQLLHLRMDGMIDGTQQWTIEPQGDNTKLNVVFEYEVPGGGLGKIADKLIIERVNSSNLDKSLENLKKLAES